jgi:very-short-patch-repair endonuclease
MDHLIREYQAGRTVDDLARELGVGRTTIFRRFREIGLQMRPSAYQARVAVSASKVIRLFKSGVGISGIAARMSCSPRPIERVLRDAGIPVRDRSAQQAARWQRSSWAQRRAMLVKAHAATRGRKNTRSQLCKAASTRETNLLSWRVSSYERQLLRRLRSAGLRCTPQKAIGPYNCDIAVGRIAVEVFGGHWHWHGAHAARFKKRIREFFDAGWSVVMIHATADSPITQAVADHVIAAAKRADRSKSSGPEYRVVWRGGELSTGGRADDHEVTIEPPFTATRDLESGRYKSIRR